MTEHRRTRVLVVTDHAGTTTAVEEAVRRRAAEAEQTLHASLPRLEAAAGGPVVGSASVRHDPMDAIEETTFSEPVDEVLLAVPEHRLAAWLHQDLPHRLHHRGIPVSMVQHA